MKIKPRWRRIVLLVITLWGIGPSVMSVHASDRPERVTFPSADGQTILIGYVYTPVKMSSERVPAVVMMHGRSGAYSTMANGVYDASTLSLRHQAWGRIWAEHGYVAVLVDDFGPRGYPAGFPRLSYDSRPAELNEVTIRPLDAYGALAYLRKRPDVLSDRIGLQGWSNGASAVLSTMSVEAPGVSSPTPASGFRAALAFYPACGLKGQFNESGYRPYAPVRILMGSADEEVSPWRCSALVERSRTLNGDIEFQLYPGATHDFDSPSRNRRSVEANASASEDAIKRSILFFVQQLEAPPH